MNIYIENVAFYVGFLPIGGIPLGANSIFQDEDLKYIMDIEDNKLIASIKQQLEKVDAPLSITKVELTLSVYGVCHLRVHCKTQEELNPDDFSFDIEGTQYADIYKLICQYLESSTQYNKSSQLLGDVNDSSKYLYHQHLTGKTNNEFSHEPDVSWSIYKYGNDSIEQEYLDLDSWLLERHVLYYVLSRSYIQLLDPKANKELKTIQAFLNSNRKLIAEHEMQMHELEGKYFDLFEKYLPIHHIDESKRTYERLEVNVEHLSEQLEDERRHKESRFMEMVFLFLSLIGLISIITGILALLPGKKQVCDTNTTDMFLTPAYAYTIGPIGNAVFIAAIAFFVAGIIFILYRAIFKRGK